MRFFFRVEYDGTRYGGWQYQSNCVSVQQLIQEALTVVLRAPCRVTGAGRTDAGVHARAQGVHFDLPEDAAPNANILDGANSACPINAGNLTAAVNALLPYDIAVYGMTPVPPDFHARYSAVSRLYKYYFSERKSPLNFKRVWPVYFPVDWDRVKQEIQSLPGVHDFTAFCSSGADSDNMVCNITQAELSSYEGGIKVFAVQADRFIYKMVRSLTGTLIDIGRGRLNDHIKSIIMSKDRHRAGATAPACGLVLEQVDYAGRRQGDALHGSVGNCPMSSTLSPKVPVPRGFDFRIHKAV